MVERVELNRYTDFDRFFRKKNFLVTVLGSALAFVFSYTSDTIINFEYWETEISGFPVGPPYRLSLTIAMVLVVAAYTRNIASSTLVAVIGALGLVSPFEDTTVHWFTGYLLIVLLLSLTIGLLADRLRLVMNWVDFYINIALVFTFFIIILGIFTNEFNELYEGYDLFNNRDLGTGTDFPLVDVIILLGSILLLLFITSLVQGERILNRSNTRKYKVFGFLFFIAGQAISLVSIFFYSDEISHEDMAQIAQGDRHLVTLNELLSHEKRGGYGIIEEAWILDYSVPSNIFFMIALTTVFTSIGLALLYIGRNEGNIEGMRGGSDVVFLAAPIGTLLFLTIGSYYVQNFVDPGGFFVAEELVVVFTTMIWAVLFLNQLVARFILFFLDRIMSPYK
ncbi:MAG: hypothetical protein ACXAB7_03900 [Candidatus Kariarchaeaceae archaeon]